MAVMSYFLDIMLPLFNKHQVKGSNLCTLARQDIFSSEDDLNSAAKKYNYDLNRLDKQTIDDLNLKFPIVNPIRHGLNNRNDQIFFREVGFDSIISIDANDFERATHILDLNINHIPDEIKFKSNWVIDFGTMEHCFHIPNYLSNIYNLLSDDGIIWQVLPCNNWVNHGFYQFSPTFLNDYYSQNNWNILERHIYQINNHHADSVNMYSYEDETSFVNPCYLQTLDDQFYFTGIVAQKCEDSTCNNTPTQHAYINQWGNTNSNNVVIHDLLKLNKTQK